MDTGVVMYRRAIFDSVDGFDTRIDACADCDLNIRITRDYPIYCHGDVILEYRQHGATCPEVRSHAENRLGCASFSIEIR
jgi:hypothetical protein